MLPRSASPAETLEKTPPVVISGTLVLLSGEALGILQDNRDHGNSNFD
jgi:hypothetical protein